MDIRRKDFYSTQALAAEVAMATLHEIEESTSDFLDFDKLAKIAQGAEPVLPVAVQDAESREMLLIAYVNREALRLSLAEKRAIFYSTSRREIWRKGETSGDMLELIEVRVNCEQNSLLFLVRRTNAGVCHTKDATGKTRHSCYYRKMTPQGLLEMLA
ncbi:phosphoribosyl-AMP cyclohydrolase [Turneriella parva]|nr:phosphoribosyl-AMP cyclohydrolase [Turneriella parva]